MVEELERLSRLVDLGKFSCALNDLYVLLELVESSTDKSSTDKNGAYYRMLSNIAGVFIDIGHMQPNTEASNKGLQILEHNEAKIMEQTEEKDVYYYNLSNAKSNLIAEKNPFNQNFETIEQLVELKSYLWKAIKLSNKSREGSPPEYTVNLGNALKQQFRLVEALKCYDDVNSLNLDVPQSWINRSESLMLLNQVSNTYSIQMLEQIKVGYESIIESKQLPPQRIEITREKSYFIKTRLMKYVKRKA